MEQQTKRTPTIQEVATRFEELAQKEMWFEIQEEFFADDVKSIDPPNSPYLGYAQGKTAVRKKGEEFVKKIQEFHGAYTTQPVIGGN
ncbi:MAG: SnoaL-like domain-containing protein, partial [Chitinophagaceae bacterium]